MVFVNFQLNQIQNCSVQIKKMKDRIFSFQMKKITSAKHLQTMLDLKMYPLPRGHSHTIKGMIEQKSCRKFENSCRKLIQKTS